MSPDRRTCGMGRTVLFLILIVAPAAAAEKAVRQSGKPESSSNDVLWPQLLNAGANPTLRYPIARMGHMNTSISFGWLDISRNSIRYHGEQPPGKSQDSAVAGSEELIQAMQQAAPAD